MEVQGEQRGRPQQLVGNLLEDSRSTGTKTRLTPNNLSIGFSTTQLTITYSSMMVAHTSQPNAVHEEESQLPDYHYFPHTPASDDGFPSQSTQHSQGSGGIDIDIDKQQEQQSQTPQTSYQHGTPLIDPVLLAEDLKNVTIKTISLTLQILNIYMTFINNSSPVAQLLSNKMCHWMNIHLQLLPNKFQLLVNQLAQCGAASDPFPSRVLFIDEKSALYITEVMAEHEQTGMLIPSSYWPDYCKDLGILIQFPQIFTLLEALMAWQLTLQAKAHKYIMQHYPLGSNQPVEDNLANAQELIQGAQFVRDGIEGDIQAEYYKNTTH
ncbi:hypothetical protein EDD17DRAFT_1509579 [Pisolithus thermaeus]|nr:hypothetical protein EDD17DRAFT_1509579 [Pisolithus thermaeus]